MKTTLPGSLLSAGFSQLPLSHDFPALYLPWHHAVLVIQVYYSDAQEDQLSQQIRYDDCYTPRRNNGSRRGLRMNGFRALLKQGSVDLTMASERKALVCCGIC